MSAFLITGLPRSRTAWLAAVANTVPGAICFHEPVMQYPSWQSCLSLWKSSSRQFVGISDSGLGFHLDEILRDHAPRVLIVRRDPQQVVGAMGAIGMEEAFSRKFCHLLADRMRGFEGHPLVKTIAFEKLTEHQAVRSCLWHLMPGASIDGDKLAVMGRLNVQADMRSLKRQMAARVQAGDGPAMAGPDVIAALTDPGAYAEVCV